MNRPTTDLRTPRSGAISTGTVRHLWINLCVLGPTH